MEGGGVVVRVVVKSRSKTTAKSISKVLRLLGYLARSFSRFPPGGLSAAGSLN